MKRITKILTMNMFMLVLVFTMVAPTNVNAACKHSYTKWTTTKKATCLKAGSRYKKCTKCGKKVTNEIKALGHIPTKVYWDQDATCTLRGHWYRECNRPGCPYYHCDSIDSGYTPALGHDWGSSVSKKTGKKKNGKYQYQVSKQCKRCKKHNISYVYK